MSSTSSKKPTLNTKAAICKEEGCFTEANIKGYCRLHFLKVVSGKGEGDAKARGKLKVVKERRQNDRFKGLDPDVVDDGMAEESVQSMTELKDGFDLEDALDFEAVPKRKKTG